MTPDIYDVIIVGSGPAAVSASFPLVEAGMNVLMLDAGQEGDYPIAPPEGRFSDISFSETLQQQCHLIENNPSPHQYLTPKLRLRGVQPVMEKFNQMNQLTTQDFKAVGMITNGGLSSIWGATIAIYEDKDLTNWPITYKDLQPSYAAIMKRIGVSGSTHTIPNDLKNIFQPPMPLEIKQRHLLERFHQVKPDMFNLWPSHNAVITEPFDGRNACGSTGMCLWGCARQSIWNARMDIEKLKKYPNFQFITGIFVEKLESTEKGWQCLAKKLNSQECVTFSAKKIFLAAGAISSTRIVLSTLKAFNQIRPLHANPAAAFMLYFPKFFRSITEDSYSMAQLSFLEESNEKIYGGLFNASMIPINEYLAASHLPKGLIKRVLSHILPASIIGNCFFHGDVSDHRLQLLDNGKLHIQGKYNNDAHHVFKRGKQSLSKSFRKLGAIMVPTSFRMSPKGADIHYGSTLPMREHPGELETNRYGELSGHKNLHIIDSAVFSDLSHKPLTLTIMANADRIARSLVQNRYE